MSVPNERVAMRPKLSTWIRHTALLALTFVTCTMAGVLWPLGTRDFSGESTEPKTWSELFGLIPSIPSAYAGLIGDIFGWLTNNPTDLQHGLLFSACLLFILIAHEMGHYIACRIYRVDATLPYFIPTPPLVGPAGTLGAFIKIMSPMPSRKAVFDIGVAGPIAGFIALLPVSLMMILTLETVEMPPLEADQMQFAFSDPLLVQILSWLKGVDLSQGILPNPFYSATWVGLLVTALNLIPSGQLDGGHAIYAVFGKKVHLWTGRVAFGVMAILSILGMVYFNSPSGFLFAVILAIMMKVHHPKPPDSTPLDRKRIAVAILTLIIFVLCFAPFPIKIIYGT